MCSARHQGGVEAALSALIRILMRKKDGRRPRLMKNNPEPCPADGMSRRPISGGGGRDNVFFFFFFLFHRIE